MKNIEQKQPVTTGNVQKMRQDIIRQFESLPDDTRDIIAQFYVMTLLDMLPKWEQIGNKTRKNGKEKAK